jgi:hypothetical protein
VLPARLDVEIARVLLDGIAEWLGLRDAEAVVREVGMFDEFDWGGDGKNGYIKETKGWAALHRVEGSSNGYEFRIDMSTSPYIRYV